MSASAAAAFPGEDPRDAEAVRPRARTRRRRSIGLAALAILVGALLAGTRPVTFDSQEELFEIPKGTWARRMAGDHHEILPSEIHLVVGIHDVLVLKNSDDVPQIFGPTLLMPGQTFRLPFTTPSENYFACTAHASGQLVIVVDAEPTTAWARLRWRARRMARWVAHS